MNRLVFKEIEPAHSYAAAADRPPATQRPLPIRSLIVPKMNYVSGFATWKEEQDLLENIAKSDRLQGTHCCDGVQL